MKKNLVKILLFISIFVLFSGSISAWDDTGHKVSAFIAWQQMSPDVREKVIDILLKAPEDSHLSVYYSAYESRSDTVKKLDLFMIAATWGDIVRDRKFKVRYENYHKGDWHYADIFWKQENNKAEILKDFPEESGKAIPKLYEIEKILRDPSAPDSEKAIALAWFLHIGGDIHNPLHNASRVTDIEPKGDQGGNMFYLTPKDAPRRMNLHSFWDSVISRNISRQNDACDSVYIPETAAKVLENYPLSKMKNRLILGNYEQWNKENFAFLPTDVYTPDLKREEMPTEKYQKNSFAVGQQQIALAGYRLGETLNQIFAAKPETSKVECKIIRRVMYPVSQTSTPDQKLRIALLDLCPENKGMVARPMMSMFVNGKIEMFEYDVVKVFDSEAEAKKFAEENNIKDANYN